MESCLAEHQTLCELKGAVLASPGPGSSVLVKVQLGEAHGKGLSCQNSRILVKKFNTLTPFIILHFFLENEGFNRQSRAV